MNMVDIIAKKRDGGTLLKEEISFFVQGYTAGTIPDYQASALLMAIYLKGLSEEEIFELTDAMRTSGDLVDLSGVKGIKADKHSTGGVGDKTSLVTLPIVASLGVPIAKMSGRGLGFTGGTIDKMESIPGMRTALSPEEFIRQVNDIGMAVIGQTARIAPADKKLYALRDVTATVGSLGLITSSIMSKKLAAGSDVIVLDVKCGDGAFMKTEEEAAHLAGLMTAIGRRAGKKTVAVVSDMSEPLGYAVGNRIEVEEAVRTLAGNGPSDLTELAAVLAGMMLFLSGKAESGEEGKELALRAVRDGSALRKFMEFVKAQGGDAEALRSPGGSRTGKAAHRVEIVSPEAGYVDSLSAMKIGLASQHAGAGRMTKEDTIDLSAGVLLKKKVGDAVEKGELLAVVLGNDPEKLRAAAPEIQSAYRIGAEKPEKRRLIHGIVGLI